MQKKIANMSDKEKKKRIIPFSAKFKPIMPDKNRALLIIKDDKIREWSAIVLRRLGYYVVALDHYPTIKEQRQNRLAFNVVICKELFKQYNPFTSKLNRYMDLTILD